jgi:DNA-binding SARP family transcriptional activator
MSAVGATETVESVASRSPLGPVFGVLGPLMVHGHGHPVRSGSAKQWLVLALLLCEANAVVSAEWLIGAVWPGKAPRNARKSLQVYVSNLRTALGGDEDRCRIRFGASGYRIDVAPYELDATRFEHLAQAGAEAIRDGRTKAGADALGQALDLWRGPALREFQHVGALHVTLRRLTQRRLSVFEQWAQAQLALGEAQAVLDGLEPLVADHPARELLRALQITALHRCGRPAEALSVYDEIRQHLAREFGMDPGTAVRAAHGEVIAAAGAATVAAHPRGVFSGPGVILPNDLPDFTGRAEEARRTLQTITRSDAPGRVVLTGHVGVGKTALAIHTAHRARATFPDGCVMVRLRDGRGSPRTAASVLGELWRTARVPGAQPADVEATAALWQAHLAGRRLLLVLDDARDEAVVRRLAPEVGSSVALITSRSRLAALESTARLTVPLPPREEAAETFDRIVDADLSAADRAAILRIVESVGRLPMGVRAAAERLNTLHHLPPAVFADRLQDCSKCLDQLTVGDTSIRSRLDAAIRDLPHPARRALLDLGALPMEPFTLADVVGTLGRGTDVADEHLETLIEHGILTASAGEVARRPARFDLPRLMHVRLRELVQLRGPDVIA